MNSQLEGAIDHITQPPPAPFAQGEPRKSSHILLGSSHSGGVFPIFPISSPCSSSKAVTKNGPFHRQLWFYEISHCLPPFAPSSSSGL